MTDWSSIVRQHGPLVWNTAHRLLSDHADASDCFQDTFLCAWELSQKEPIRSWPAVLRRLTTVRALERLRRRYRHGERNEAWPDAPLADDDAPDPSQRSINAEIACQLRVALSQIDPKQAEVFCLSAIENVGYREVADQLGLSVSHVGVLLHRARKRLRDLMMSQDSYFSLHGPDGSSSREEDQ